VDPYAGKLLILFAVMSIVGIVASYYERHQRSRR